MLIERITINTNSADTSEWPFTIPAVRQIAEEGLKLTSPLTFLVGENGSGKSTLVEAIAEAWGISPRGGRGKAQRNPEPGTLAERIGFDATSEGRRYRTGKGRSKSFFLRAEAALDLLEFVSSFNLIVPGYPQEDLRTLSHGEGYLAVFREIFSRPGFYLMDEPEAALSFSSSLQLVAALHDSVQSGAQVICATHSPVIAATPGADILELTEDGIRPSAWEDLDVVTHWRTYLNNPGSYLRHLV
ncbi:AAA family ATPase [Myceligenerans pegani]|uniref:AAA family ATPase n=1 Tax=Myceligenerans pegani TaxID=2776917 RepID=A0ABR9MVP7_9MICO|nr:AAA family ATPase [Myceligenerans sp. TRM 65318]MBE1875462.1 AAA family ATPase [Myceligenerans sp. TRM 65318]MBE3017733.1 AAA family ATPase [Myceligenerans sp. TRM 65318]